jgi:Ca2+-transporting ATPase
MTDKDNNYLAKAWKFEHNDILESLSVSIEEGLDQQTVRTRRKKYGHNRLRQAQPPSALQILWRQFKSLIMLLLAGATALSFFMGDWIEGIAIIIVILLTVVIGFVTEIKAVRSMEALRKMSRVKAVVRRNGQIKEVAAEQLVPGDIVVLDGGDIVTADLRLVEANKLRADESALTGESVPVNKTLEPLDEETGLAERRNMLFKGTAVTSGSGAGVVVATGMHTELGRITELVEEAKEEVTPLEKRLEGLGHKLIWITLSIAAVVALMGIFRGKEIYFMVKTAIALAVAAIPEGLPIVATVALARGMIQMARRNALINRLASVETLGATTVIFTDKTGTLTENKMTVTRLRFDTQEFEVRDGTGEEEGLFYSDGEIVNSENHEMLSEALRIGVLCSNASLPDGTTDKDEDTGVGDPLEVALLVAGSKAGIYRDQLLEEMPEEREESFDPETKMMATFHRQNDRFYVAVKGAPEAVLQVSSSVVTDGNSKDLTEKNKKKWLDQNNKMAEAGLRVLALARKVGVSSTDVRPYEKLEFFGLVGLLDPPRAQIKDSIAECRNAGIRVIMVTGDQAVTAKSIADQIDLNKNSSEAVLGKDLKNFESLSENETDRLLQIPIFARVSPKQKLDLVAIHQKNGSVVAMTGDGVNDAPSLKKADIGIAMGKRGTQVACEASDMILKDDAFSTIVLAVKHGRVIFNNIRKFVVFLLSGNVGEVLSVGLASLANAPLPLLPLQILFINLVMDVFPALALGLGGATPNIMQKSPRDAHEAILTRQHWFSIVLYGAIITVPVLGILYIGLNVLGLSDSEAVTLSFLTLAFARLWHVLNMRDNESGFFRNEVTGNRFIWGAIALCTFLVLLTVYVPGLADILDVVNPGQTGWAMILIMSMVPLVVGQFLKYVSKRTGKRFV